MSEIEKGEAHEQEEEQPVPKLENQESDNALEVNKDEKQKLIKEQVEEKKQANEPEKDNIPKMEQKIQGQPESKQEKESLLGQQPMFLYPEQRLQFQQLQPSEGYRQHQNQSSQLEPQSNSQGIAKRKNKKRIITNPNQLIGHWSEREHKTYLNFLMAHKTIMESQDMKKTSKIFKLMSEIIGTRSPSQCRSHHQKFNPFVHHIKKRQKGAGRKRKEAAEMPIPKKQEQVQENSNFENSNAMLQQFMIQNPPFYMPQSYLMNQPPGQNMGGFFPDQQIQQNPDLNFTGGQPLLNFHQPPPPPSQIQQLLRPIEQDELDKQGNYLMSGMKDQMMMPSLQLPQMFQMPPQQNWYPQQFAMPNQQSDDKNQYYNFSFIQAPLSFNINYMAPPPMFNQDGAMPPLDKQLDPTMQGPQHFPQFFPYFPEDPHHQMLLSQNDLKQQ